ncbi:alpha/beta hydrolase [Sphingosinicella humi]|uniref:BD-FAE-like domain-containing protein n=1 Tax=Allosphingosinicella humi TaxID=2068657 RepID=A0A2U2J296_9SPHN|nr:alpha/beta hydrolase [Sphingosinicella humi]PWG02401.1 hypothetical protein DF286_05625 [Sphingosinicella humi]
MDRVQKIARWSALIVGGTMAAALALLLLGAHFYSIAYLSPYASIFLNWFSPWFVVLPLFSAALIWIAGPRNRRGLRKTLSLIAVAVAVIGAVAVGRMIAVAHENGVSIDLVRALGSHPPLPDTPDQDVVYSRFEGEPLGLVLYKPAPQEQPFPAPVLVYIHGGGWVAGDRFAGGENLRWFARRGWLTISIDYPLSSRDQHLWAETIEQVGCALAWVQANAHRFGADPTRISLMGDSAGGNLVLIAGYRANSGTLPSSCGGNVPRVAAISAIYPAVHVAEVYRNEFPQIGDMARGFADAYVGGSPDRFPDRYTSIDPASYIAPESPPTLLIVGENDHLLPPDLTYRFAAEAKRGGVDVELVRFPYGQHLFDQSTNSIGNQLVLGATRRFLEAHGQGPAREDRALP